jgi:hypothetical protein
VSQREVTSDPAVPAALGSPAKGTVVGGKYAVDALIGCGAMGYVMSATHVHLGQAVALKILRPELVSNPDVVARFATEARAVARIDSEHVARVFDVGVLDGGAPFIVMELLTGSDLANVLAEGTRFSPETAVGYVLQACEALAIAHSRGIVHRDIKPENLFLARTVQGTDVIKVLDFGISKLALQGGAIDGASLLVRTAAPLGSPVYMSPEQVRAATDLDARTDLWSLGCVLYELLAGKVAFDAGSITQLCAAILERPAPSLRSVRGDIHPRLDDVIARCLEKRREHRYADVADLALALLPFARPSARVSVERCCYVLRSAANAEAEVDVGATGGFDGRRSGAGLSLTPATIERPDLVATAVESASMRAASLATRASRELSPLLAGTLVVFALALTALWGLDRRRPDPPSSTPIALPRADATPGAAARGLLRATETSAPQQSSDADSRPLLLAAEPTRLADAGSITPSRAPGKSNHALLAPARGATQKNSHTDVGL